MTGAGPPRILVLSYWNLNHSAFGGGTRVLALMRALGSRGVLCQPAPAHPDFSSVTVPWNLGRRKRAGINWGMFNYFLPSNRRKARAAIRTLRPALIVHTSMWTHAVTRGMRGLPPMVLDAHDVNASAIAERYGPRHPATRAVLAWEKKTARAMDHVFACSERDRAAFESMYGLSQGKVTVVPNGVDLSAYGKEPQGISADDERWIAGRRLLLFMGKLDYQPNREALDFLDRTVMPALDQGAPGAYCLIVVGGAAPEGSFHPAIRFAGRVPEVIPFIRRADICLSPIFSGSGTRLKILEYLAARKPVVSTPKGAEGLELRNGRDLLLAEPGEFAQAIQRLEQDPPLARRCADSGHEQVSLHYTWSSSQARWRRAMEPWIQWENG